MRIGAAAEASGASVRALRYYEAKGLIEPGRTSNGYRDYCPSTIATIRHVRSLLEAGLPVRLIREALPYVRSDHDAVRSVCDDFLREVAGYRDRLAARVGDLRTQLAALDAYLDEAGDARS